MDSRRSPYHRDEYRGELAYPAEPNPPAYERPRPASAHEQAYGDMYDSGIHTQSISPRGLHPYTDNPGGLNVRAASLDRRTDIYGTLRSNVLDTSADYTGVDKSLGRQGYTATGTLKSIPSNPGISAVLAATNPPHRRAQSYDMNLEKQGLTEYGHLLAAAGVGPHQGAYAPQAITSQLQDYSALTVPTLSSLGGIDYGSLHRPTPAYPLAAPNLLAFTQSPPDLIALQREYLRIQHELEVTREKLVACTTSIRTFWSPELKRERAMRKEENAKYAILADHLHNLQLEKQTMLETLHNMEADLRRERDRRLHGHHSSKPGSEAVSELDATKRQLDERTVEIRQLKKTVEEADRRTASLKASLSATEDSLRRLVEAVKAGKSGNPSSEGAAGSTSLTPAVGGTVTLDTTNAGANIRLERIEADRAEIGRLRSQLNEACTRGSDVERQLVEQEYEYSRLKEEFNLLLQDHQQVKQENDSLYQETRQTQTLQSLVDTKESKILTLENEIRLLEDEIARLREDGLVTPNTSMSSGFEDLDRTMQAFRSNERLLKSKVDMLNGELSKRDCEIYTLQSRLEMTDKQLQDQNHHITVLKEQVKTREHKISMLTADTEDFRKRLKEKDMLLDKKTKTVSSAQAAKRQAETDLAELKDQLDIKERKVLLLQRKIENLEDLLNDKEIQLATSKARLSRITAGETTTAGFDEPLKDKDAQLERLKEVRYRSDLSTSEEVETQQRLVYELRSRLESAQREIDEKASQLLELREELSDLRTARYRADSEASQLKTQVSQKTSELAALQLEKQLQQKQIAAECELKYGHRIMELEGQLTHCTETVSKLQADGDRLVRSLDAEKAEKERVTRELQDELHESQSNLNSLKRSQQSERKKNTQVLEEARQREESAQSDVEILKALRESVRLTTERDIYASGRDDETRHLEQQLREIRGNAEQLQRERNNLSAQLVTAQEELSDREGQLKTLEQECFQNYLPELERLRRANHEANMRVAVLVKVTQGREHQLTEQDRHVLSGIPLFPNLASPGAWPALGSSGLGTSRLSGSTNLLVPGYYSGGTSSPHLAGSAFQLIGTTSSGVGPSSGGRASVPGQSLSSPEVVMLTRMLQEKETMLQQHLQELTHLRFQNSELEVRLKATQREMELKAARLESLQVKYSTGARYETSSGITVPSGMSSEVMQLRKAHQELTAKVSLLQLELDEKDRRLCSTDRLHTGPRQTSDFSEMAVLRRELVTVKAEKEIEIMNLNNEVEKCRQEKAELDDQLQKVTCALAEKSDQTRLTEAEKDKILLDKDALQKKYEAVLKQISEKDENLKRLETECYTKQVEELAKQKKELEDLRHHTNYLQSSIQERENRNEVVEKELYKIREEMVAMRKQLTVTESDLKHQRDEAVYREERLKHLQAQHTEELSRLRSANQEQATRNSHLEMKLDEKEHNIKTQASELRSQVDEILHLRSAIEDANGRLSVSQKRIDERELRLRKLENENHDLLDEIHGLRKGNTELESQVDMLRQQLLDKHEIPGSRLAGHITQSNFDRPSMGSGQELERLRKQYNDLVATHEQTQTALSESQIQYDQMTVQRNNLKSQLDEEMDKRAKVDEKLKQNDELWKIRMKQGENSEKTQQASKEIADLRRELERKIAQIECLTRELRCSQTASVARGDRTPDLTSQSLLIADLEVRLRQTSEERDQVQEQLASALSRADSSYLEAQHMSLVEKETLQQQIASLTQTAHNATGEAERFQRESRQANSRVQQLSRQLQETQNNCDAIARQRDSLRDQLDQMRRSTGRSSVTAAAVSSSVSNLFGMRPASVAATSYETGVGTGSGPSSHLAREMDRLHREVDSAQSQLRSVQEAESTARAEAQKLRDQVIKLTDELADVNTRIAEVQKGKEKAELSLRGEMEKTASLQNEVNEKLKWTQQQLNERTNQVEQLSCQLDTTRQYCGELEQKLQQLGQRLSISETQQQQLQTNERERCQQLEAECTSLRNEVAKKQTETQRLSIQLDQLGRDYDDQTRSLQQMTIELRSLQGQLEQAKRDLAGSGESASGTAARVNQSESDWETIQALKAEIKETAQQRAYMEEQIDNLQNQLQKSRQQLEQKDNDRDSEKVHQLQEEVSALHCELQNARHQIEYLGGPVDPADATKGAPLKMEIDALKREIVKRDDAILNLEKECKERHTRRIEAMQGQLRRYEEEVSNLNKVLDEQRVGLEEREQVIRQLRANQSQASSVELEKVKKEHARCKEQFDQQSRRIDSLLVQIEKQSDEVLAIRLEAMTASLCEKEANLALMELTAPKNATSAQALEKLRTERDQLQQQHRQLSNTRAMLEEEKKSRK